MDRGKSIKQSNKSTINSDHYLLNDPVNRQIDRQANKQTDTGTSEASVLLTHYCRMYIWWHVGWTRWRRNWSRQPSKATRISECLSVRNLRRQLSRTSYLREYWNRRSKSPTSRRLACMLTCTRRSLTSTRFACILHIITCLSVTAYSVWFSNFCRNVLLCFTCILCDLVML